MRRSMRSPRELTVRPARGRPRRSTARYPDAASSRRFPRGPAGTAVSSAERPVGPGWRYRSDTMSAARMSPAPLVHVRTVPTTFHARVIAARLGAEGILTQLRGNVGGPYPIGDVSVWVAEEDADVASELLLADEIEAAFDVHPDDMEPSPSSRPGGVRSHPASDPRRSHPAGHGHHRRLLAPQPLSLGAIAGRPTRPAPARPRVSAGVRLRGAGGSVAGGSAGGSSVAGELVAGGSGPSVAVLSARSGSSAASVTRRKARRSAARVSTATSSSATARDRSGPARARAASRRAAAESRSWM